MKVDLYDPEDVILDMVVLRKLSRMVAALRCEEEERGRQLAPCP